LEVRGGSGVNKVIVLPARELSGMEKIMESRIVVPLAAHCVIASRKLPGPLSVFVVTVNVFAKAIVWQNTSNSDTNKVLKMLVIRVLILKIDPISGLGNLKPD